MDSDSSESAFEPMVNICMDPCSEYTLKVKINSLKSLYFETLLGFCVSFSIQICIIVHDMSPSSHQASVAIICSVYLLLPEML